MKDKITKEKRTKEKRTKEKSTKEKRAKEEIHELIEELDEAKLEGLRSIINGMLGKVI